MKYFPIYFLVLCLPEEPFSSGYYGCLWSMMPWVQFYLFPYIFFLVVNKMVGKKPRTSLSKIVQCRRTHSAKKNLCVLPREVIGLINWIQSGEQLVRDPTKNIFIQRWNSCILIGLKRLHYLRQSIKTIFQRIVNWDWNYFRGLGPGHLECGFELRSLESNSTNLSNETQPSCSLVSYHSSANLLDWSLRQGMCLQVKEHSTNNSPNNTQPQSWLLLPHVHRSQSTPASNRFMLWIGGLTYTSDRLLSYLTEYPKMRSYWRKNVNKSKTDRNEFEGTTLFVPLCLGTKSLEAISLAPQDRLCLGQRIRNE